MIAFPFIVAYLLLRCIRDRRYLNNLSQRFGFLPDSYKATAHGAIWLHAVSVGEVLSSLRLLERLRAEYPARQLFVSTTTLAGRTIAGERLAGLVDGIFYTPIDYCFAVRRVLRTLRPSIVVVLETEIWPNLYRETKRTGAGLLIANGRISDDAMPRYIFWRWLFRQVLSWPDLILAQSEIAVHRYKELGAPPERVRNAGNLKYDFDPAKAMPPGQVQRFLEKLRPRQVWIAASTMPPANGSDIDEDDVVLEAFGRLAEDHPGFLLLLAPRRPARFDEVAGKMDRLGIAYLRRSQLDDDSSLRLPAVFLLDSIGELSSLFPAGDVVFMGGTLARRGGHNILEPAFFGRPIIIGPHMENFPSIAEGFREGGGVREISSPSELAGEVDHLLRDPGLRADLGESARKLAEAERGATERIFLEIQQLSLRSIARQIAVTPLPALLWPLSVLWGWGGALKRARAMARRRSLKTPVISVGGIGMGGAGKTPFVQLLAKRLDGAGMAPAILSRGYRRTYPEKATVVPAGASARTALTGDEVQLFLNDGIAPVGIGADRYLTGRILEDRFQPGVILLDDAFQHWRLYRDVDIVLIDGLYPFGGEAMFPLGRLREPLEVLERADVFLITRAEKDRPLDGIEARLRKYNARAPVFRSRVEPLEWIEPESGQSLEASSVGAMKVAAFCGLANPSSFWLTLSGLGCRPSIKWTFGDHHHYRPQQLRHLARQAEAAGVTTLVTTEKDSANLPSEAAELVAPLHLMWLRIGMVVEREEELLNFIHKRLREKTGDRGKAAWPH